jgi:hypothetical protein
VNWKFSFNRAAAIAGLTLVEALRQPFLLLLTVSIVLLIALLPALLMHTMGDAQSPVQDSALALHFVGGLLLAGYTASATLGREIRRGTLANVFAKPVNRELYFLAKFAGIALVLALFSIATGIATWLSAQSAREPYTVDWVTGGWVVAAPVLACGAAGLLNYFAHRTFVATAFVLLVVLLVAAAAGAGFRPGFPARLIPASLLVSLATLVLAAIALGLISRFDLVPTLAICTVIFLAGLMTDYLLGRSARTNAVAALGYNLLPNWQHFWTADALAGEGTIPWTYVRQVAGYAMFYLMGVLSLGMLAFRNVETKA